MSVLLEKVRQDVIARLNEGDNILDSYPVEGSQWSVQPFQKVSLLDMIKFLATRFCGQLKELEKLEKEFSIKSRLSPGVAISLEDDKFIRIYVNSIDDGTKPLNLVQTPERISRLRVRINGAADDGDKGYSAVQHEIRVLRETFERELAQRVFIYLPKPQSDYYDQPELFGVEVAKRFPKANEEIKEAGNCYATGCNTACVFHLMRAVEVGARAMVSAIKAQKYIGHDVWAKGIKTFKKKPIELCDWKVLRDGLKRALTELENGSATSARKKATLSFYSHAVSQFGNFKDAWRNNISHGNEVAPNRKLYLVGETEDIMNNARHFMRHLATRLKE